MAKISSSTTSATSLSQAKAVSSKVQCSTSMTVLLFYTILTRLTTTLRSSLRAIRHLKARLVLASTPLEPQFSLMPSLEIKRARTPLQSVTSASWTPVACSLLSSSSIMSSLSRRLRPGSPKSSSGTSRVSTMPSAMITTSRWMALWKESTTTKNL